MPAVLVDALNIHASLPARGARGHRLHERDCGLLRTKYHSRRHLEALSIPTERKGIDWSKV